MEENDNPLSSLEQTRENNNPKKRTFVVSAHSNNKRFVTYFTWNKKLLRITRQNQTRFNVSGNSNILETGADTTYSETEFYPYRFAAFVFLRFYLFPNEWFYGLRNNIPVAGNPSVDSIQAWLTYGQLKQCV